MKPVHLSDGQVWPNPVIIIEEDLHTERPGYYRAFQASSPDATTMVTLVGYCSPGGSFKTVKETVRDAHRREPDAEIYRKGRRIIPS